jgi:hypothetical protein
MKNMRPLQLAACLAAILLAWLALTSFDQARAQGEESHYITGIALMPFWLGKPDPGVGLKKKSILDCTLAELCYLEGDPLEDAAQIMNEMTQLELETKFGAKTVPFEVAERAYTLIDKEDTDTLRSIAVRFGRKLDVDHVVAGTLWRFRERQGRALAAESPASVAFALFLVKVEDGEILWEGTFNKTQQPLTDNLLNAPLYMKEGFKWLTAREFARHGAGTLVGEIKF